MGLICPVKKKTDKSKMATKVEANVDRILLSITVLKICLAGNEIFFCAHTKK